MFLFKVMFLDYFLLFLLWSTTSDVAETTYVLPPAAGGIDLAGHRQIDPKFDKQR